MFTITMLGLCILRKIKLIVLYCIALHCIASEGLSSLFIVICSTYLGCSNFVTQVRNLIRQNCAVDCYDCPLVDQPLPHSHKQWHVSLVGNGPLVLLCRCMTIKLHMQ